jgi:hypothetical protein
MDNNRSFLCRLFIFLTTKNKTFSDKAARERGLYKHCLCSFRPARCRVFADLANRAPGRPVCVTYSKADIDIDESFMTVGERRSAQQIGIAKNNLSMSLNSLRTLCALVCALSLCRILGGNKFSGGNQNGTIIVTHSAMIHNRSKLHGTIAYSTITLYHHL